MLSSFLDDFLLRDRSHLNFHLANCRRSKLLMNDFHLHRIHVRPAFRLATIFQRFLQDLSRVPRAFLECLNKAIALNLPNVITPIAFTPTPVSPTVSEMIQIIVAALIVSVVSRLVVCLIATIRFHSSGQCQVRSCEPNSFVVAVSSPERNQARGKK